MLKPLNSLVLLCLLSWSSVLSAADNEIMTGVGAELLENDLDNRFTHYIKSLMNERETREEYLNQLYGLGKLRDQIGNKLNPIEKEAIRAELASREFEVLRDAMIKHELEALELDIEALAKERYEVKKDTYKTKRQIKLAQIFVAKETDKQKEAAEKAQNILKQLEEDNLLNNKKDDSKEPEGVENAALDLKVEEKDFFAELAREHSDGKFAAQGGFNAKWIVEPVDPKAYDNPVVKGAFDLLARGQISDVIESDLGFHILRLMAYKPNRQMAFDEVKGEIIGQIKNQLWMNKSNELMLSLQPPKKIEIDDELVLKILKEVYDARDESLKKAPAAAPPIKVSSDEDKE